ncbi:MAG TPA: FHA domain-containing protein [Nakamurella sp.]|nr:FHA domain-containing protein [Nakamurella sp.]
MAGYLPGERWLVVADNAAAYLDGDASDALRLWQLMSEGAGAAELLEAILAPAPGDAWLRGVAPFLLAVSEPDGLRVIGREIGTVTVRRADGPDAEIDTRRVISWTEALVARGRELVIGTADPGDLLPVPTGVVRASAVRWSPEAAASPGRDSAAAQAPLSDRHPEPAPALAVPSPTATITGEPPAAIVTGAPPSAIVTGEPPAADAAHPRPAAQAAEPPADLDADSRSIEETRFDIGVDPEDLTGMPEGEPPPPIVAVPGPPRSTVSPLPAPGSGSDGDHDGLTQFAEDVPVGYTPPPLPAEPPPGSVLAVLCPVGHPNAPHTLACRLCGQLIGRPEPVPVPPPVLARIRLTTGEVVDVDRPVVIGRAPYASSVAASDPPRLVTVPSPNQDISRAHAQIRAADWQLVVSDLHSTNGTTVRPPGRAPQRLHPGQEMVVEPGWAVDLGDGVSFVVEALG